MLRISHARSATPPTDLESVHRELNLYLKPKLVLVCFSWVKMSYQLMLAIKWMIFIQNTESYNQAQMTYTFRCCRKKSPNFFFKEYLEKLKLRGHGSRSKKYYIFIYTFEMSNRSCICRIMLCFIYL